ncbi:MAG: DMT family transporter [Alphaproteobacteria bacterium]|nr:DMT family transporter [Alphaproteobacteria bacterium]
MPLRHDWRRGAILMLGATALFTIMAAGVKLLSARIPFTEIMFFRCLLAMPVVAVIVFRTGDWGLLRTRRPVGHLARAMTGTMAMGSSFFSLALLPLPEQTALSYTTPLFVTLLAIFFLGERPGIHRWGAVLVGFAGIMVIAVGQGAFAGGLLAASAVGVFFAVNQGFFSGLTTMLVRNLSATEKSTTIVMWQSILMTVFTGLTLPFVWVTPMGSEFLILLGVGLTGGIAQVLLTEAHASAQVSSLGPLSYSSILWAMLLGFLIWGDVPTLTMLGGAGMIVAAGLYILHRELLRKKRP